MYIMINYLNLISADKKESLAFIKINITLYRKNTCFSIGIPKHLIGVWTTGLIWEISPTAKLIDRKIVDSRKQRLKVKACLQKQKQPSRDVLRKKCFKNMQLIYRKTFMPKSDFNNVSSGWVFSCKFAAYILNTFS